MSQNTPEFVRWAIEHPCPLRDLRRWHDPEQTERQLRPLRAYSDAVRQGRMLDGICVAGPPAPRSEGKIPSAGVLAFDAEEVLAGYGGREEVESHCGPCPANVGGRPALAGCHGSITLALSPQRRDELLSMVVRDSSTDDVRRSEPVAAEFPPRTTPPWYGLWIAKVPGEAQRRVLLQIAVRLHDLVADGQTRAELERFAQGLQAALRHGLPLHVALYPAGRIAEGRWHIPPHCTRCRAPQDAQSRRCRVCGRNGRPSESRRRGLLGSRPFRPLTSLLGGAAAGDFLARYAKRPAQMPAGSS